MKEETRIKINDNERCIKGIDEVPMFSWNTKTKEFYVLGHKFDGVNSIEDFINYIHNLDKENKSLQSQLKAKEETINKAIKHVSSLSSKGRGCEIYADVKRDILEILSKGENK